MITMNQNESIRHNIVPPIINQATANTSTKLKWFNLTALFFTQFLFSQIVLSYGMYTVDFIKHGYPFTEALWPPIIFLTSSKIFGPWCRDLAESYYEYHFRPCFVVGVLTSSLGISLCSLFDSPFLDGLVFGILGGFGSSLIFNFLQCHLLDIFPYQTQTVLGIQHLGIAFGIFLTPHIIQLLFDIFESRLYTFLIHGALLLNALPFGLLLKKSKLTTNQSLTAYNNIGVNENYGEEMIYMANIENHLNTTNNRCWKSPSDNLNMNYDDEDDKHNDEIDRKTPSPVPQHKTNTGVDVLPQIVEEDEEDTDDDTNLSSKRNSVLLTNNLKRMSVISNKFEELIIRNEDELVNDSNYSKHVETILDDGKTDDVAHDAIDNEGNNLRVLEAPGVTSINLCCCTPYRKYKCQRNVKSIYHFIRNMTITPIITSCRIIEFYPSLLTNIHSMLSPLIFFNLIAFQPNSKMLETNLTELAFMFSITGFAYLVFLLTLPWITEISKRNLKYLYMSASLISAFGIYLFMKTDTDDFRALSCLIYGFGFGVESYLKEIVLKESLGVTNWSQAEGTLECFSGILFFIAVISIKSVINVDKMAVLHSSQIWLNIIFYTHFSIFFIWVSFPLAKYLYKRNRDSYHFNR